MSNVPEGEFLEGFVYEGIEFLPFPSVVKNNGERFGEIKKLDVKEDDVLLAVHPRSGTHWFFEMISMLVKGKAEYTDDMIGNYPELVGSLSDLDKIPSPRVLVAHLPYRFIPDAHKENGAKVIHVVRNPKAVLVSMYNIFKSSTPVDVPWPTYVDNAIQGKGVILGGWFNYEREYEEASKRNKNARIHLVYYEDTKEDPVKELRRIAEFLEIKPDEQLLKDITEKCSFQNMKKADETIKSHANLETLMDTTVGFDKYPIIFRKGESNDWKNLFTVAQNEQYDAILKKEDTDAARKYISQ